MEHLRYPYSRPKTAIWDRREITGRNCRWVYREGGVAPGRGDGAWFARPPVGICDAQAASADTIGLKNLGGFSCSRARNRVRRVWFSVDEGFTRLRFGLVWLTPLGTT